MSAPCSQTKESWFSTHWSDENQGRTPGWLGGDPAVPDFFLSPECRCSSFALKGLSSFKWTISLPIDLNTDLSSPVKRENKNVTIKPVVFSKESWQQSLSAIKCDVSFVKSEFARMCCSPWFMWFVCGVWSEVWEDFGSFLFTPWLEHRCSKLLPFHLWSLNLL